MELSWLESLLTGAKIPYGRAGDTALVAFHPVSLFVRETDLPEARQLLASLQLPSELTPAEPPPGRGTEVGSEECHPKRLPSRRSPSSMN